MRRSTTALLLALAAAIAVLIVVFGSYGGKDDSSESKRGRSPTDDVSVQIKSPHFVDSAPAHGQRLASVPLNVVVNFNFNLTEKSRLSVLLEGEEVATGDTRIDESKLAMRRDLRQDVLDGDFIVKYKACWPDGSCHDGRFGFHVDGEEISGYKDLTGKASVRVDMEGLRFVPARIRVSPGTRITWVNRDKATHFVNTDPHPSHNFYPLMNSRGLKMGDTYSITLNRQGEYPYHCSAHYPKGMVGSIIVEP